MYDEEIKAQLLLKEVEHSPNPLLDYFLKAKKKAQESSKGSWYFDGYYRNEAVKRWAWAIPTPEIIQKIKEYSPLIEIGAGNGYWALLLKNAGINIIAYDINGPKSSHYFMDDTLYYPVKKGGPHKLIKYRNRNLFLCWPPYDTKMAYECIIHFHGKYVIYIGEKSGGCTGDDAFHEYLWKYFECVEEVDIPQWSGIHDNLYIFKNKGE